jgi:hypothetical protein
MKLVFCGGVSLLVRLSALARHTGMETLWVDEFTEKAFYGYPLARPNAAS